MSSIYLDGVKVWTVYIPYNKASEYMIWNKTNGAERRNGEIHNIVFNNFPIIASTGRQKLIKHIEELNNIIIYL